MRDLKNHGIGVPKSVELLDTVLSLPDIVDKNKNAISARNIGYAQFLYFKLLFGRVTRLGLCKCNRTILEKI
ncbi:hypothetical protein MXMO3_03496 (plasmid) [Maritalea myrionectae]|uniref:Uncharacterized protein n=1 Tax=Maritalea myrionectae TaxID=454601 RepID=A0A2R4MJ41_9HYPH|nr:hypothetical protein MXMO3_03496 [Maritalea myrionectae]